MSSLNVIGCAARMTVLKINLGPEVSSRYKFTGLVETMGHPTVQVPESDRFSAKAFEDFETNISRALVEKYLRLHQTPLNK